MTFARTHITHNKCCCYCCCWCWHVAPNFSDAHSLPFTITGPFQATPFVCVCVWKPKQVKAAPGKMPKNNLIPNNHNSNNKWRKSTWATKALYFYDSSRCNEIWQQQQQKPKNKIKMWKRNEKCRHISLLHFHIFTLAGNSSTANCQRPAAIYGAPLLLLLPF